MAPAHSTVRLTVKFWKGPEPEVGDGLETKTGRRYMIGRLVFGKPVNGKLGPLRALECVVLAKGDLKIQGQWHEWTWAPRPSKAKKRAYSFRGMRTRRGLVH